MPHIVFQMPPRIVNGPGSFSGLASEVKRTGASRALLVMDPFLSKSGFAEKTVAMLEAEGVTAALFDRVEPEPPIELPGEAAAIAADFKADTVVAVGGGASMDIAKVLSVLVTNPGVDARAMVGVGLVEKPGLQTIFVPTTAGSGSELTSVAVFSDNVAKTKVSIWSPHLLAKTVILDAELTLGLPPASTAATGMDALIHAIESYTCKHTTPASELYAEAAIPLITENIRLAFSRGENLEARANMLTGAFYAGVAFSNSSTGGVHALSSPIGSEFHIPHGVANSIMLLPVLRKSIVGNVKRYARVAALMGEDIEGLSARQAADVCCDALDTLMDDLRIPRHLAGFGVKKEDVPALAAAVVKLTRLLGNNPYTITYDDAVEIYLDAL